MKLLSSVACVVAVSLLSSRAGGAQVVEQCSTDRAVSALVGAGLGLTAAAIPATIIHRHDQTSSHRIVIGSTAAGALIGVLAAGRDRPCRGSTDSLHVAPDVIASRSSHAKRGAIAGAVTGGVVVGVVGSALLWNSVGCDVTGGPTRDPCNTTGVRVGLLVYSTGLGALTGTILGSLVGWAWPVGR